MAQRGPRAFFSRFASRFSCAVFKGTFLVCFFEFCVLAIKSTEGAAAEIRSAPGRRFAVLTLARFGYGPVSRNRDLFRRHE